MKASAEATSSRDAVIVTDASVPLVLAEATYNVDTSVLSNFRYKVINQDREALVAYIVAFDIEPEDGHGTTITFTTDSFVGGANIRPGEEHSVSGLDPAAYIRTPLRRARARVAYAEYADGKLYGQSANDTVRALDGRRREVLAVYGSILARLRMGGDLANGQARLGQILSDVKKNARTPGERTAIGYLTPLLEQAGYEATLKALGKQLPSR
jgi:hypothetical protein